VKPPEQNALPVALAAVLGPKGLLLIRREFEPFRGMWGMPGGKMRRGEHLDEAVERELREETGISARFSGLCGAVTESVFAGRRLLMHYLLMVCRLRAAGTALRRSREGDAGWFPRRALAKMGADIVPSDRLMLERLVLRTPAQRWFRCVVRKRRGTYEIETFA